MPPQNEIIKDVLTLIKYCSGGFQTGEVQTPSGSDFPFIRWDLHLTSVTRFHINPGPNIVLERIGSQSQFAVVFSPEGVLTKDMCTWISTAALLGFDVLPYGNKDAKAQIVVIHYDDYDHSELFNAIKLLEDCGIKVPYAPSISSEDDTPFRDVSNGLLEVGHKVAEWIENEKKRKIKAMSTPPSKSRIPISRIRYTGKLTGPLRDYFDGRNAQAIYDGITKQIENLSHDTNPRVWRKDTPDPAEFVAVVSLGHYALPNPPAQKWVEPKEAWHVRQTLENTDIIENADREVDTSINTVVGIVEDYIQIWKGCCEYYCISPALHKFKTDNLKGICEIADFTGARSALEAYASGVAVEDILA